MSEHFDAAVLVPDDKVVFLIMGQHPQCALWQWCFIDFVSNDNCS